MSDRMNPDNPLEEGGKSISDHFELLAMMGRDFAATQDIEDTVARALVRITRHLNAAGGALFLLDAAQTIGADGYPLGEEQADPLVDALVAAAEHEDGAGVGQAARRVLVERTPLWGEQDPYRRTSPGRHVFDGSVHGLRSHEHSGTPSIGMVVEWMRAAAGVVTQLVGVQREQPVLDRPAHHARALDRPEQLREQRQHVETQSL